MTTPPTRPGRAGTDEDPYDGPSHVVRPRWSWTGLVLLVLGGVVAGVGVAVTSLWVIVVGAVVLVVGALAALRGNLFYDVEATGLAPRAGRRTVPGSRASMDDERVRAEVRQQEQELAEVRSQEGPRPRPSLRRPAAGLLVAVGIWLITTQGVWYAESDPSGRVGTYRAVSAGIVLVLPGLYLLLKRSSVPAAALCLAAGVGLVLGGLLAEGGRGPANELVCGVLVLLAVPWAALPALRGRPRA